MRIIDKIFCVFAAIVFVSFLIRHGQIDFTGIDFVTQRTEQAVNSPEGQSIISELVQISHDVLATLTGQVVERTDDMASKYGSSTITVSTSSSSATVVSVIDGDTLLVKQKDKEIKVRLIGIDTPESVNPDASKNNEYGTIASNYTKSLVSAGSTVYLEYDEDKTDDYGRTLAYVWLRNDKDSSSNADVSHYMLNGILIANGYAVNKVYKPNDRYSIVFASLRTTAEKNKIGLWQYDGFADLWTDGSARISFSNNKEGAYLLSVGTFFIAL